MLSRFDESTIGQRELKNGYTLWASNKPLAWLLFYKINVNHFIPGIRHRRCRVFIWFCLFCFFSFLLFAYSKQISTTRALTSLQTNGNEEKTYCISFVSPVDYYYNVYFILCKHGILNPLDARHIYYISYNLLCVCLFVFLLFIFFLSHLLSLSLVAIFRNKCSFDPFGLCSLVFQKRSSKRK